jgi:hypothetical protein
LVPEALEKSNEVVIVIIQLKKGFFSPKFFQMERDKDICEDIPREKANQK